MEQIPKIIHQIWSGVDEPLPDGLRELGKTWKENHPEWKYIIWDNRMMDDFVQEYYPQYRDTYNSFTYNIQRWDAIRYLILYQMGGMYTDFDSECLRPLDELLINKTCCFSLEPREQGLHLFGKELFFNNALMMSVAGHPFMKAIIDQVFNNYQKKEVTNHRNKGIEVQWSTGPLMLVSLYERYERKDEIYLIPSELTSPFTRQDTMDFLKETNLDILELKLKKAYSVHYFFNEWTTNLT